MRGSAQLLPVGPVRAALRAAWQGLSQPRAPRVGKGYFAPNPAASILEILAVQNPSGASGTRPRRARRLRG